jgi:hypothetical protein
MLHFTVNDYEALANGCVKCCCEQMALKPGSIEPIIVNYAPWALPIGRLNCAPQVQIEAMETCPTPTSGDLPPQIIGNPVFYVAINGHLDGDLTGIVGDPENNKLVFKLLPMYGPAHGKLVFDQSGMFDYDPFYNYKGPDRFYASASDGVNAPLVFEVRIGVEIDPLTILPTPSVSVDPNGIKLNDRYYTVSFPVKVSPAAKTCEVWRLTVLQGALDCDCQCYARTDCFDIKIVKC